MTSRFTSAFFALLSLFFLSSCLDYEEKLTVAKDLSGEAEITVTLPDKILPKYQGFHKEFELPKIQEKVAAAQGVTLVSYSISDDRRPVAKLHVKFTSLDKYNEAIQANRPANILMGDFKITREGGTVKVDRQLGNGVVQGDLPDGNFALYTTHFDSSIKSTNSPQYNAHGQDVRYRYKLTDVLRQKPIHQTVIAANPPWMWILVSVAVIGVLAFFGWQAMLKKSKK